MALPPRGILRSNTQSTTNTTRRVTWADQPFQLRRPPPPSIVPPSRARGARGPRGRRSSRIARPRSRPTERVSDQLHTRDKHHHTEKDARRRRRADGVVKKRTNIDARRTARTHVKRVKKKKKKKPSSANSDISKKKKKCRRGLLYARVYVVSKAQIKQDTLEFVDARTMYKIYADVRGRLGKKVDERLRRRMLEEENKIVEDKRLTRRTRKNLDAFVNKMLPGVKAEAFSKSQVSRAAAAAVLARFDRVQREKR